MKIGTTELLIILTVVLLIFGPSQIPKLTRMVGRSVKSFQKGMTEEGEENSTSAEEKETI